jgi:integrase
MPIVDAYGRHMRIRVWYSATKTARRGRWTADEAIQLDRKGDWMKGFRLHDVRHGFASISLKQGTSVKEVSELLGHSSPLITLSTYAHTTEGVARDAVNRLANSLVDASRGEQPVKCEKSVTM